MSNEVSNEVIEHDDDVITCPECGSHDVETISFEDHVNETFVVFAHSINELIDIVNHFGARIQTLEKEIKVLKTKKVSKTK